MKCICSVALLATLAACGGVDVGPGAGGAGGAASSAETTATSAGPTAGSTSSSGATTASQGPGPGAGGNGGEGAGGSGQGGASSCELECRAEELCGGSRRGIDDDCDGEVDEGCPCVPGQASDCFLGDPSHRTTPGCFPGSMRCTPEGTWGSCDGGAHAFGPEPCQERSLEGCHPISAVPFQAVDLRTGTGTFGQGADPGSESWSVSCPPDVPSCAPVSGSNPPLFPPLQSGEYTVRYSKEVAGRPQSCSYPLLVGARGLRVELTWNFGAPTDLDLHMLQPGLTGSIEPSPTGNEDCAYSNCGVSAYLGGGGVEWFPATAPFGEPVAWYLDPVAELNSCYHVPIGIGEQWAAEGRGCHNPRLDLDNISCSPSQTDVDSGSFCVPENINVDFPPRDVWTRVGVINFNGAENRPTMRIFCDGALKAVLGPEGFDAPVTIAAADFISGTPQEIWFAADVAFVTDGCSTECVVSPIHQDPVTQTPYLVDAPAGGPAFPPLPTPGD